MTQEEKAKRYDEAIEKFDVILNLGTVKESGTIFADDVRKILPELAESEDEKTKKEIINYLECQSRDEPSRKDTHNKWISYIEKYALSKDDYSFLRDCAKVLKTFGWQSYADRLTALCPALGEEAKAMMSTPIIFDESEDERIFEEIYKDLHTYYMMQRDKFVLTDIKEIWDDKWSKAKAWLEKQGEIIKEWSEMKFNNIQKELQEMVDLKHKTEQGEQKQEWSEEDECILNAIKHYLFTHGLRMWCDWIKSLRPQNTWKPSDEQMKVVEFASRLFSDTERGNYYSGVLQDLLEQLKKLKE